MWSWLVLFMCVSGFSVSTLIVQKHADGGLGHVGPTLVYLGWVGTKRYHKSIWGPFLANLVAHKHWLRTTIIVVVSCSFSVQLFSG